MSAGEYRDLLTVQSSTTSENESNELVETWVEWCQSWGKVEPLGGSEHSLQQAQINLSEIVYSVELRADPLTMLISPKMRVLWVNPGGSTVTLCIAANLASQKRDTVQLLAQERP